VRSDRGEEGGRIGKRWDMEQMLARLGSQQMDLRSVMAKTRKETV